MYNSDQDNKSEFHKIFEKYEKNYTLNSIEDYEPLKNDPRKYFKGYDTRNITVKNEEDELITIVKNFEKQHILKQLNNSAQA